MTDTPSPDQPQNEEKQPTPEAEAAAAPADNKPAPAPASASRPKEAGEGAGPAGFAKTGGDGAPIETEEEKDLWEGRTSPKHFAGRLTLWALFVIGLVVLCIYMGEKWSFQTGLLIVVIAGGITLFLLGWKIFKTVVGNKYRLTTQRLFITRGIISTTTDQTELIRVDDVRVTRTLVDRIFGLGSVHVMSTDASDAQMEIEGVLRPDEIAEKIRKRMRAMRQKSLFVERL